MSLQPRGQKRSRPPRIIIALDLDCFYAQVAVRSRPHLRDKPVVIVQKHLCVTSNYVARAAAHGAVQKMTPVSQALKACPHLVLIDGSDLTPFRAANNEVVQVVREFLSERVNHLYGCGSEHAFEVPCQKLGLDEIFIDASEVIEAEVAARGRPFRFEGHLVGATDDDHVRRPLMLASQLAAELRARITRKTALTLCAGVSTSKLLSKLAVNMNKPNDQTIFLPDAAAEYVGILPPRSLPGFGYAMEGKLKAWAQRQGAGTDFRTARSIAQRFGADKQGLTTLAGIVESEVSARHILGLCRGEDDTPVIDSGDAPKSITSMDSCRQCSTMEETRERVRIRAVDLVTRLLSDYQSHSRRPRTLTVSFRFRGNGFLGTARATSMPSAVASLCSSKGAHVQATAIEALVRSTLRILKEHGNVCADFKFDLTLISIGASNFTAERSSMQKIASSRKRPRFFGKNSPVPQSRIQTSADIKSNAEDCNGIKCAKSSSETICCPVCGKGISKNVAVASLHVDGCLRRSNAGPPAKLIKTPSNTKRVDSFFRPK